MLLALAVPLGDKHFARTAALPEGVEALKPKARIIYYAADRLDAVGAHPFISRRLLQDQHLLDRVVLRSEQMKADFNWAADRLSSVGFGVDKAENSNIGPSPYAPGQKVAVSVGSMLFDPAVFRLAAAEFPDIEFHVIGCGTSFDAASNVRIHPEMRFADTLPFVNHATVGIAAYRHEEGTHYLADSSLKLAQFEHFGLPAVCPTFAQGSSPSRFGYEPGDPASIRRALQQALAASDHVQPRSFPSWSEVALQVLEPERYPRTAIR
jgi:2-beta-glucuronyltransferase